MTAGVARADDIPLPKPGRTWTLSVAPTYTVAIIDDRTAHGAGAAVDVGLAITDAFSVHAGADLSWHPVGATKTELSGTLGGFSAMLGFGYTLDVIRLVPSFDLALGVVGLRGDPGFANSAHAADVLKPITALAVALGFNLDYRITRLVAVGVEVRYHIALTDASRLPMYLYTGPRVLLELGR